MPDDVLPGSSGFAFPPHIALHLKLQHGDILSKVNAAPFTLVAMRLNVLAGRASEAERHMATPAEASRFQVLLLALRANHDVLNIFSAESRPCLRQKDGGR
jgi:hypothetical protein